MRTGLPWQLFGGLLLTFIGAVMIQRTLRDGPAPAGEIPSVTEVRDEAPLPTFSLRGPKGPFTNNDLTGRWSFMFFGYTQCPDICPTALTLMKDVKSMLAVKAAVPPAPTFQVVFVPSIHAGTPINSLGSTWRHSIHPSSASVVTMRRCRR